MTGETETRLTGEAGAQVAEEIDIGVPDDLDASAAIPAPTLESVSEKSRLDVLECELSALRSELHALRNELEEFKKSFG